MIKNAITWSVIGLVLIISGIFMSTRIAGTDKPVATPTAVTWPKKITFEATSLRRDKSLIAAFAPPSYMLGDEPLVVSTYETWQSEPYIMTGPGYVGMSTLDGTCTIKVDGEIVSHDSGSEARCNWEA